MINPELASRYKNRLLDILLTHIIHGEQTEAETIIQHYPALLLHTSIVSDYSGRKIEGTALQLALGAEDVKYHDDEECMVEMIHRYLRQLPNGESIIAEQTAKQFPEGWEIEVQNRISRDLKMLSSVINDISNATSKFKLKTAVNKFRKYLESENENKIIRSGIHFNHSLLIKAYALYKQNYNLFDGFHSDKNMAVWNEVIGTIQRYIPANMAQALCTGLGLIVDKACKLNRTLNMHDYNLQKDVSYFPLDSNTDSILGQHCAISSYHGAAAANWVPGTIQYDCLITICLAKRDRLFQHIQTLHKSSLRSQA